jgi:GNAT superfamily N-acetyltransferase
MDAILSMEKAAKAENFFESKSYVGCIDHAQGVIAGFVSILQSELTWCYVDPLFHRQGIGRRLVEHVLPMLGVDGFVVCVKENPGAIAFYLSLGFVVAARFPGEAHGFRCECVRLTLPESRHRWRPPTPAKTALRLAGFTQESPGKAVLGEDGVFYWR